MKYPSRIFIRDGTRPSEFAKHGVVYRRSSEREANYSVYYPKRDASGAVVMSVKSPIRLKNGVNPLGKTR